MLRIIFIILSLLSIEGKAQIIIKGKIISEQTGLPVEYANIGLEDDTESIVSGKDGSFIYKMDKNNKRTIKISHVSYQTQFIPYSDYFGKSPLIVKLKEKKVNLPNMNVVAKDAKMKRVKGRGLRAPVM